MGQSNPVIPQAMATGPYADRLQSHPQPYTTVDLASTTEKSDEIQNDPSTEKYKRDKSNGGLLHATSELVSHVVPSLYHLPTRS